MKKCLILTSVFVLSSCSCFRDIDMPLPVSEDGILSKTTISWTGEDSIQLPRAAYDLEPQFRSYVHPKDNPYKTQILEYNKKIQDKKYVLKVNTTTKKPEIGFFENPFLELIFTLPGIVLNLATGLPPIPITSSTSIKAELSLNGKTIKKYEISDVQNKELITYWWFGYTSSNAYKALQAGTFQKAIEELFAKIENDINTIENKTQSIKQQQEENRKRREEAKQKRKEHLEEISQKYSTPWCHEQPIPECLYEEQESWGIIMEYFSPDITVVCKSFDFAGLCNHPVWIHKDPLDAHRKTRTAIQGIFLLKNRTEDIDDYGRKSILDVVERVE